MSSKCISGEYHFDEQTSPAGPYRCYNDCMCDGRRKCFVSNTRLAGICTGDAQSGTFAGCPPKVHSPTGHLFNNVAPLDAYVPPLLNAKEKATLRCLWGK